MKPDFVVRLASASESFTFEASEVPEHLPFGGDQLVCAHQLPGGDRIVDVMGGVERDIGWTGLLRGQRALERARALDRLRRKGEPLDLTWHDYSATVIVLNCHVDVERLYLIRYAITMLVIENEATIADKKPGEADVDTMMRSDVALAQASAAAIGDNGLTGAVARIGQVARTVVNFVTAASERISAVLAPVLEARETVRALIMAGENIAADPIGEIMAGEAGALGAFADLAEAMPAQLAAMGQLGQLYGLERLLARMETNLNAIGSTGALVTQAGGDLYRMAAQAYGDATAWVDIARANGLVDPVIDGVADIVVPAKTAGAGGVLSAAAGFGRG